jgi:hypothetical protein
MTGRFGVGIFTKRQHLEGYHEGKEAFPYPQSGVSHGLKFGNIAEEDIYT